MIPELNRHGYLPEGIHKAFPVEIKRKFGIGSLKRRELFKNLRELIKLLRRHKQDISQFLLDGSYVTSKQEPGDIDCIIIVKHSFNFNSPEAEKFYNAKSLFNAHVLFFIEEDSSKQQRAVNFFGHDRNQIPKGLLEVIL